jgi:hypothetical protein
MMTLIVALIMMALTGSSGPLVCREAPKTHASIQWSEKSRIIAPNRTKYIEVNPILTADDNQSPVELKACGSQSVARVLVLTRSANVHWSSDSSKLLVIDRPGANSYVVRLFDIKDNDGSLSVNEFSSLNDQIRNLAMGAVPSGSRIEFFRPSLKSWSDSRLTIRVRGTYSQGGSGPMGSFCFDTMIDSRSSIPRDKTMGHARSSGPCLS